MTDQGKEAMPKNAQNSTTEVGQEFGTQSQTHAAYSLEHKEVGGTTQVRKHAVR